MKFNLTYFIFILLLLSTEFISNLGAVDKIGPQWLYLGIINGIIIIYIFSKNIDIKSLFQFKITNSYLLFICFCLLSMFFSVNLIESLNYFSRILLIFVTFINFTILIKKVNINNILWLLSFFLAVESIIIFDQFVNLFDPTVEFGRNSKLIGVASNINIAGFSIALLLPFALQLFTSLKHNLVKVIFLFILSISSFSAFLTGSRGAAICVTIVFLAYFIKAFMLKDNSKNKIFTSLLIILPFLISIFATEVLFKSMSYSYRMNQVVERGSNSRLKYYSDAIESIKEKPILGVGIGNWKFNSIDKGKRHIEGYIVPYHAHNDFLQILAETGILGFGSYISIFIFSLFRLKNLKNLITRPLLFSIFLFLGVYFIDANLNFPFARPIMQIKWALILAILVRHEK